MGRKLAKWKIAIIIVAGILVLCILSAIFYANMLLNRANINLNTTPTMFDEDDITPEPEDLLPTESPDGTNGGNNPSNNDEDDEDENVKEKSDAPTFKEKPTTNKNIYNVLLIGMDRRSPNENGRSDTMIIATFDKKNKKLKLTSILRDNYVHIPGNYRDNRINASFAYGHAPLLMKTINTNFNLNLEKYVAVDFNMFTEIIDIIGDVNITLTDAEAQALFGPNAKKGTYNLNAEETLKFTRLRKIDSDFQRTNRQRRVLEAIYKKCMKMDIFKLNNLLYNVLPYVETNLTKLQLATLMKDVFFIGNTEIEELHIPYKGTYQSKRIRGMAVLVPDVYKNAKIINDFIYG